jgi:hypothetical protein
MKTDITPDNSLCPIFLEPADPAQVAADAAEAEAQADALAARTAAREALLARLGITAEEAQLLLGGI